MIRGCRPLGLLVGSMVLASRAHAMSPMARPAPLVVVLAQISDAQARDSGPGHSWQGGPGAVHPYSHALNTAIPLIAWHAHDRSVVSFAFHHCSQAVASNAALGPKWQHSYDTHLLRWKESSGTERAALVWGNHRVQLFALVGSTWVNSDGYRDLLTTSGSGYQVLAAGHETLVFEPSLTTGRFRLDRTVDRSGNVVDLTYDAGDQLISVADGTGRSLDMTYGPSGLDQVIFVSPGAARYWTVLRDASTGSIGTILWGRPTSASSPTGGGGQPKHARTTVTYTIDGRNNVSTFSDRVPGTAGFGYVVDDVAWIEAPGATSSERTFYAKISPPCRKVTDPTGVSTIYEYDSLSRMVRSTDALGNATKILFADPSYGWKPSRITEPSGSLSRTDYDSSGRIVGMTDELGKRFDLAYDSHGNMIRVLAPLVTDAWGNVESARRRADYQYDSLDRLVRQLDYLDASNYVTTSYAYDSHGNLQSTTDATGAVTTFAHDGYGNLTQLVTPAGRVTTWKFESARATGGFTEPNAVIDGLVRRGELTRDRRGRLIQEQFPDGSGRTYLYDAVDRLVRVENANGATEVDFARQGWIDEVRSPTGTMHYDHLANGLVSAVTGTPTTGAPRTLNYSYDALNRLVQITDGSSQTQWTYDQDGRPLVCTQPNGASTAYTYDAVDRPIKIEHFDPYGTRFSWYDQAWQENGLLKTVSEHDSYGTVDVKYAYDFQNRLTRELRSGGVSYDGQWTYDGAGNRTSENENGAVTNYTYDLDHRLLQTVGPSGTDSFTWDANGRLDWRNRNGTQNRFLYDFSGRLLGIDELSGTSWPPLTRYTYDGLDRRIRRETYRYGSLDFTHDFLYDGSRPFQEYVTYAVYVPTNDWQNTWYRGLSIQKDALSFYGNTYFSATDGLGTLRGFTNHFSSVILTGAMHNAFGKVIHSGSYSFLDTGFAMDAGVREEEDAGLLFRGDDFYDPVADMVLPKQVFDGLVVSAGQDGCPGKNNEDLWRRTKKELEDLKSEYQALKNEYWDREEELERYQRLYRSWEESMDPDTIERDLKEDRELIARRSKELLDLRRKLLRLDQEIDKRWKWLRSPTKAPCPRSDTDCLGGQ